METVLRELSYEACLVYLDDIIIVGRTFEDYLCNIRKVLEKLRRANLKLNPTKCKLFSHEGSYIWHIISGKGVGTDSEKISVVENWSRTESH